MFEDFEEPPPTARLSKSYKTHFFYYIEIAIFSDNSNFKLLWFGKVPVTAHTIEEARQRGIEAVKDYPIVKEAIKFCGTPHIRVYSIIRTKQVFKTENY